MTTLMDEAVDVGTTKRLTRRFMSLDSVPVQIAPETVTLQAKDPDGAVFAVAVHRDIFGNFYGDVNASTPGQWRYHWTTTNPVLAFNGSFVVRSDFFTHYEPIDFNGALGWTEF